MSGVTGDFSALDRLIGQFDGLTNGPIKRSLVNRLAVAYEGFMTQCFAESHGPNGEAWAPLRSGRGKPFLGSRMMHSAVTPANVSDSGFTVIVDQPYANVHQYGAVIAPKRSKHLCFPGGGGFVFTKQVTIPARPFMLNDEAPAELSSRFDAAADDFMREYFT